MTSIRAVHPRATTAAVARYGIVHELLLISGALSSLIYVTTDLLGAMIYPGYDIRDQAVSELSAVGAPTAGFWSAMMVPYAILFAAFAIGVWREGRGNRALRATGALLIAFVVVGFAWRFFPMHERGAALNWQDVGHIVISVIVVLLMLAWTAVGAFALDRRFRLFSLATLVALLLGGSLSFVFAGRIAAGLRTPWLGIIERVNVYGYLLWIAVLSVALLRRPRPA